MRKVIGFLFTSLLLTFSSYNFATGVMNYNPAKKLGGYIGVQAGYGDTHYDKNWLTKKPGFTSVSSVDHAGASGRIFLGYEFNQFFAAETGFLYTPKVIFNDINNSRQDEGFYQYVLDLFAKGTLPLGKFGIFGKAGGAYIHRNALKKNINGVDLNTNSNDSIFMPAVAGGVSYRINDDFFVDASYHYYFASEDFENVSFVGLGIAYRF